MTLPTFYLLGLIFIGLTTFLIGHSIHIYTPRDQNSRASIATWGAVMATLWIVVVGLIVISEFTSRK